MTQTLFIDFETYYSSAEGYTLKKISMLEYIRSPKFKVFGAALKFDNGESYWVKGDDLKAALQAVDWPNTVVVAQNVKFDGAIIHWIYGHNPKAYYDTLSMSRAVLGYLLPSHSLAKIADYFGFLPKGFLPTDNVKVLTPELERELAAYCIHDNELCAAIYHRLLSDFPPSQFKPMDWTMRKFIDPLLELDHDILKKVNEEEKLRRARIFEEIGISKDVFSSNQQFADLLSERGFEVPMKTNKNGKKIPALSVSDEGFRELAETDNEELRDLIQARMAAKSTLLETRSEKFLRLSGLGAYPFDINFSGAQQTHRYAGGNGAGGNPQNLPARGPKAALRSAVRAPAGHKIIVADFAGIELRIQAWLARELKLVNELVLPDGDPYSTFATQFYGRTITKKNKEERQFGKTCVLGLGYGMGPKKFRYKAKLDTGIAISDEESKRVVNLYRTFYPGIPALWETLTNVISFMARGVNLSIPGAPFLRATKDALILPSGLKVKYPNLRVQEGDSAWLYDGYRSKSKDLEEVKLYGGKFLENICQALAGEICKTAIERAESWGLNCVGQVHDEILVVVPAEQAEQYAILLRTAMEQPLLWWPSIHLKAEVGIGDNWLEAKGAAK